MTEKESKEYLDKISQNQLTIAMKICLIAKRGMLETLDEFKNETSELRILRDHKNQEQMLHNRFIKNEIIWMAEQIEGIKKN